jgi:hypothetical protein
MGMGRGYRLVALVGAIVLIATAIPASAADLPPEQPLSSCPASTSTGFADVPTSLVHARAIACLVAEGITQGRTTQTYDPAGSVTRAQMASFIDRTLRAHGSALPAATSSPFTDVSGEHAVAIARLHAAGIAQGTSPTSYDPNRPVRRDQMATFLARAARFAMGSPLPPFAGLPFDDVGASVHRTSIEQVVGAGIARGVSGSRYEPARSVTRAQMASFLARTLSYLDDQPPSTTSDVPETTKVLDAAQRAALLEMTPTSLRFDRAAVGAPGWSVGDVLVSRPAPAAPYGVLARVTALTTTGTTLVVATAPADLTDAIHRADISVTIPLTPDELVGSEAAAARAAPSSTSTQGTDLFSFREAFDGVVLASGAGGGLSGQVVASGHTEFSVDLELDLSIRPVLGIPPAELRTFDVGLTLDQDSAITIDSTLEGAWSGEHHLRTLRFTPLTYVIPSTPPIPVVLVPTVDVTLDGSGQLDASMVLAASSQTEAAAGVRFTADEGWEPYQEVDHMAAIAEPDIQAVGKLEGSASVAGRLELYGLAGIELAATGTGRLDVRYRPECLELDGFAGLNVRAGLSGADAVLSRLPAFDRDLVDFERQVLETRSGDCSGYWVGTIDVVASESAKFGEHDRESATVGSFRSLEPVDGAGPRGRRTPYHADVAVDWYETITGSCAGGPRQLLTRQDFSYEGPSTIMTDDLSFPARAAFRLYDEADGTYFHPYFVSFTVPKYFYCGTPSVGRQSNGALSYQAGLAPEPDTPLADEDPDPNRLVGSTTYDLGSIPGGPFYSYTAYQYMITYDLTWIEVD